ncbi:SDR family oxidoreductase [Flavobacteriaceae bacterium LMO-SS05]
MDLGLHNRKACIMASSSGLGKAVALELSKEGADIMLCGRTESTLIATKKEIEAITNGAVYYVVGDVASKKDREKILEKIKTVFGTLDILITNTGGPPTGAFESFSEEDWQRAYKSLLESAVGMIKGVLPYMKKNNWGRIVTITSQAVKQPVNSLILSNTVRASLLGLVKTLSNELGAYHITVNNVMPGYTRTERLEKLIENHPKFSNAIEEIPLKRFGEPSEFAAAVAFLVSERASYITGVSLAVDGGWIKGI